MRLVKVEVEALKALVAKTRELNETVSENQLGIGDDPQPYRDEIEALVTALGAQGVDL